MYGKDAQQGEYKPKNPSKYIGKGKIYLRSSWERKLAVWLDHNKMVLKWSSENVIIPYRHPIDNQIHRYFVDFYAEIIDNNNKIRKILIEVKPLKFCSPPKEQIKKTKRYITECIQWGVNESKWNAAKAYCELKGLEFIIMTEESLGIFK